MMNKILLSFKKIWYVYLLSVVVGISASSYWCNFINRPQNEQTISIFMGTYTEDTSKLRSELKKASPDYLKETNILNVKPNSSDFGYYFVNNGLNKADIFILPESYVTDDMKNKQFAELNSSYLSAYFNYESESSNHGVYIHKTGESDNDILSFKTNTSDENYYLFFRINSLHIGEMNNSQFDTAIKFAKVILEYE